MDPGEDAAIAPLDVAQRCGKAAGSLKYDWGQPIDPAALRKELAT